jgi:hypothetical protein
MPINKPVTDNIAQRSPDTESAPQNNIQADDDLSLEEFVREAAYGEPIDDTEAVIAALGGDDDLPDCQNGTDARLPECQNDTDQPASEFTGSSKPAVQIDNPVNETRPVSSFRDARTMRQIRTLHENPDLAGDTTLLVTKPLFTRTYEQKPWWDTFPSSLPSPARQYRTPAPWRDVSDLIKITFRHVALKTLGPVYSLSLRLSNDVEAAARAEAYPLGWLHRRISLELQGALGRSVEFHLVAEEDASRRLHLHGEIQIAPHESADARGALKRAGGEWDAEASNRQLHMRSEPDAGWMNYLTLDLWRISYTRDFLPRYSSPRSSYAISFNGGAISSTKLPGQKSAELYTAHRRLILDHCQNSMHLA